VNQLDLDHHIEYIAHQLYQHLEESGRFKKLSNPIIPSILEEVYKPLVKRINDECNERIDIYQKEIELLKKDLIEARLDRVYVGELTVEGKRVSIFVDGKLT
jgi:hypothetical protein